MKYLYCPPDPKHYATDLHLDAGGGILQWACGRGQDTLVVQTPYGQGAEELMENLCRDLGGTVLEENGFTKLKHQFAVRFVSTAEKIRRNGCPHNGGGRTYTVFACVTEGDTRRIFADNRQSVSSPRCDVPMRPRVEVSPVAEARRFLRRGASRTGFYRLSFPETCDRNYTDGDLAYQTGDFSVPITRRMFEAGTVYIKSAIAPRIVPRRAGIELPDGGRPF